MWGEKSEFPVFRLDRWAVIAVTVLVFLAGSVYAQSLQQRQQECERLFSVAAAAERQGDFIEAELRYQECRELAQRYRLPKMEAAALHRLAVIRARNNRFSESANMFRRALELDPRNAPILNDYAQLYASRRNFAEAEVILKNALSIDPNNQRVLFNLGVVIAMQRGSRQTEGLRYLKLAVGDADAYRELARILRNTGDINRAEFMDQKAQLAESRQPVSPEGDSDRPQRVTHQPQTPPEIVNRVRQELIELEIREIAATPPVAQTPSMPTSADPPGTIATSPREIFPIIPPGTTPQFATPQSPPAQLTAVALPQTQPSPPTALPADPFAMVTRQQEPPPASLRRLEPPTVDTAPARPAVRALPNRSEPLSGTPLPNQNRMSDTSVPVQSTENRTTNKEMSAPSVVRVASSPLSEQTLPQRTLDFGETPRHISLPSVRALPSDDGRAERAAMVNPLRRIQANRPDWIDSGADTLLIAALPAHSAVGVRRMPRTDQNDFSRQSNEEPNTTEPQQGRIVALRTLETAERTEVANTARLLTVRDVDILRSPSAVITRREASESGFTPSEHSFVATNLHSEPPSVQAVQATPELERTRVAQSNRRFSTATTPDVLSFAPVNGDTPPSVPVDAISVETPVEIAVRPLEPSTPSLVVSLPATLPQITANASDCSKEVAINVAPTAPLAPAIADPFPMLENQPSLAEVRRTETRPSALPALAPPTVEPAEPFPVASVPPRQTEARTTLTPLPALAPPAVEPAESFPVASTQPQLAETRTVQTPPPIPAVLPVIESADPFPVANNLPRLAEARTAPFSLTTPARESVIRPSPPQEESAGFASSRRTAREVSVSDNDEPAGFARSRR